jgi:hypothetical protein
VNGSVVVDKDVWAIRYRLAFKESVEKKKELTILVACRIQIFLVGSAELPVIEESITVPFSRWIRIQSRREYSSYSGRIGPEFNVDEVG